MEISTLIGLFLGVFAVGLGIVLKGASLVALWNPAAFLIIIGGTFAALFIGFPLAELKKIPKLFKKIFIKSKLESKKDLIKKLIELSALVRKEGLLSLEDKLEEIDDKFLRKGMQMIVDGMEIEVVKNVLLEEVEAMEDRHRSGALIFTQAGTYAPTLGVLGAVVGLIAALGNLNDIEVLGHSIAAAFVATLLGIFTGYVLWHPIANKLKRISKLETEQKYIIVEGIAAIRAGISPIIIEQRLIAFLSGKDQEAYFSEKGEEDAEE